MSKATKPPKYPCGHCSIGVKYSAIFCTGPCKMWYHGGCANISDKQLKKMTEVEINTWACKNCSVDPSSLQLNQTIPESHSPSKIGEANAGQPLLSKKMEDIHSKVKNLQDTDDLETSITLAAEVGNALLAENSTLKKDLYEMTLRNSLLAQNIKEKNDIDEIKYQAKIEELESENESLRQRNTSLVKTLHEMEQQLIKEKKLQTKLSDTFEELDREREMTILSYEKELKELRHNLIQLKQINIEKLDHGKQTKTYTNTETQTRISALQVHDCGQNILPLSLDIDLLKSRQDQIELAFKTLQYQMLNQSSNTNGLDTPILNKSSTPNTQADKPNQLTSGGKHTNTPRKHKTNVFSVSLQRAKFKNSSKSQIQQETQVPATSVALTSSSTPQQNDAPILKKTKTQNSTPRGKKPPITAMLLKEGESWEDFFKENLEYYKTINEIYISQSNTATSRMDTIPAIHTTANLNQNDDEQLEGNQSSFLESSLKPLQTI